MEFTEDQWLELWNVIADIRDASPRVANDADTGDIVDAVERWLGTL